MARVCLKKKGYISTVIALLNKGYIYLNFDFVFIAYCEQRNSLRRAEDFSYNRYPRAKV